MKLRSTLAVFAGFAMMAPMISKAAVTEAAPSKGVGLTIVERIFEDKAPMPEACRALNLEENQKAQIKDAYAQYKLDKQTQMVKVKTAHEALLMVLEDQNSTRSQAEASTSELKDTVVALADIKTKLDLNILYDILKPEQRQPATTCASAITKQKKQEDLKKVCAQMPADPNPNPMPSPSPMPIPTATPNPAPSPGPSPVPTASPSIFQVAPVPGAPVTPGSPTNPGVPSPITPVAPGTPTNPGVPSPGTPVIPGSPANPGITSPGTPAPAPGTLPVTTPSPAPIPAPTAAPF